MDGENRLNESSESKRSLNRRDALKGVTAVSLGIVTGAYGAQAEPASSPRSSSPGRDLIRRENEKTGRRDWMLTNTRTDPTKGKSPVASGRSQFIEGYCSTYDGPKGNVVFNGATIWWANGLASPPGHVNPSRHGVTQQGPDERVQQITHNLFQRFRIGRV